MVEGFALTPVYKEGVLTVWPRILQGLEIVVGMAATESSKTRIMNELLTGNLLLWYATVKGEYVGYAITGYENYPLEDYRALTITHSYLVPGSNLNLLSEGERVFYDHALQLNCCEMKFKTMRPLGNKLGDSFIKRLNPTGDPDDWHITYVEIVKKVKRREYI
jgi:hypothetical protein